MADQFTFMSSALPDDVRVIAFRGVEALSRPFEYEIFLRTASAPDIDLVDATLASATLTVEHAELDPHQTHGVLRALEVVHHAGDEAIVRVELVPRLWLLSQSVHSRVFTDKSAVDVAKEVFDLAGLGGDEVSFALHDELDPEEHITQYRESDLAFVTRWLEREGIFYYFDCSGDVARAVFVDANPGKKLREEPVPCVPYFGRGGDDVTSRVCFDKARLLRSAKPAAVKLKDYDYLKPKLAVAGEAAVFDRSPATVSEFGDRFFTPAAGERLARIRAEAMRAHEELLVAEGGLSHVRPGYELAIEEHPWADYNQAYLAMRVEVTGMQRSTLGEIAASMLGIEQRETVRTRLVALPAKTPYRPERKASWPRIHAQELAVVDGESDGEYAQLDAEGRYKVRFLFDEGDGADGKASTWVRMMQPHGGNPEGFHFPLRKGTEVVVTFLGGDPDRPIICGTVPNAENPSPVTQANATRNILITGGRNKLEIEDQDGQQWVNWFSPTKKTELHMGYQKPFGPASAHLGLHTDGTSVFTFGGDWWVDVGGKHDEHVVGTVDQRYDATKTEHVAKKVHEKYDTGQLTEVKGAPRELQVTGDLIEHCTGSAKQDFDTKHDITTGPRVDHVKGTLKETADGAHELTTGARKDHIKGKFDQTADAAHTLTTGPRTDHVKGPLTQTADGPITVTAPSITQTSTGPTSLFTNSSKATFTYGATFSADLSASLALFAGVKVSAELALKISATAGFKAEFGSAVSLRSAPLQVTLGAAMTTISASGCVDVVTPCLMVPAASIVLL
jgi:type VI secretion system secreted protein VgrG